MTKEASPITRASVHLGDILEHLLEGLANINKLEFTLKSLGKNYAEHHIIEIAKIGTSTTPLNVVFNVFQLPSVALNTTWHLF